MVRVFAAHRDVQRRAQRLRQRPEEVRHEFGGQFADALAIEFPVPHEIGAAAQIEGDLRFGLIHGQQKAVARNAALVAQRLAQRRSQGQRAVLDGVMFIDLQIPAALQIQGKAAVFCDLFEHMIEKPQAAGDLARALARQIHFDADVGFSGLAMQACAAIAA